MLPLTKRSEEEQAIRDANFPKQHESDFDTDSCFYSCESGNDHCDDKASDADEGDDEAGDQHTAAVEETLKKPANEETLGRLLREHGASIHTRAETNTSTGNEHGDGDMAMDACIHAMRPEVESSVLMALGVYDDDNDNSFDDDQDEEKDSEDDEEDDVDMDEHSSNGAEKNHDEEGCGGSEEDEEYEEEEDDDDDDDDEGMPRTPSALLSGAVPEMSDYCEDPVQFDRRRLATLAWLDRYRANPDAFPFTSDLSSDASSTDDDEGEEKDDTSTSSKSSKEEGQHVNNDGSSKKVCGTSVTKEAQAKATSTTGKGVIIIKASNKTDSQQLQQQKRKQDEKPSEKHDRIDEYQIDNGQSEEVLEEGMGMGMGDAAGNSYAYSREYTNENDWILEKIVAKRRVNAKLIKNKQDKDDDYDTGEGEEEHRTEYLCQWKYYVEPTWETWGLLRQEGLQPHIDTFERQRRLAAQQREQLKEQEEKEKKRLATATAKKEKGSKPWKDVETTCYGITYRHKFPSGDESKNTATSPSSQPPPHLQQKWQPEAQKRKPKYRATDNAAKCDGGLLDKNTSVRVESRSPLEDLFPNLMPHLVERFAQQKMLIQTYSSVAVRARVLAFLDLWHRHRDTHRPILLFHGTHRKNIRSVVQNGFIVPNEVIRVANGSAFGVGIYTALDPGVSFNYTRGFGPCRYGDYAGTRDYFVCVGLVSCSDDATKVVPRNGYVVFSKAEFVVPMLLVGVSRFDYRYWRHSIPNPVTTSNKNKNSNNVYHQGVARAEVAGGTILREVVDRWKALRPDTQQQWRSAFFLGVSVPTERRSRRQRHNRHQHNNQKQKKARTNVFNPTTAGATVSARPTTQKRTRRSRSAHSSGSTSRHPIFAKDPHDEVEWEDHKNMVPCDPSLVPLSAIVPAALAYCGMADPGNDDKDTSGTPVNIASSMLQRCSFKRRYGRRGGLVQPSRQFPRPAPEPHRYLHVLQPQKPTKVEHLTMAALPGVEFQDAVPKTLQNQTFSKRDLRKAPAHVKALYRSGAVVGKQSNNRNKK